MAIDLLTSEPGPSHQRCPEAMGLDAERGRANAGGNVGDISNASEIQRPMLMACAGVSEPPISAPGGTGDCALVAICQAGCRVGACWRKLRLEHRGHHA